MEVRQKVGGKTAGGGSKGWITRTPTEPTGQAGQRGEVEKKYEVEIKREAGGANDKSRWDTDVVAAFAVEG